jgi:hypothetical protein
VATRVSAASEQALRAPRQQIAAVLVLGLLQVQRAAQVDGAHAVRAGQRHALQHGAAGVLVAAVQAGAGPGAPKLIRLVTWLR